MYLFVVNIIGLGAGTTAIALLTDHVFHDDNMLRYSLLISGTGAYVVSALLWWRGLNPYRCTGDHAEALRSPQTAPAMARTSRRRAFNRIGLPVDLTVVEL